VRSIASLTLWLFVIGTSLILGAGLYEALVVVPFWSVGAPASLAQGNPLLQVHVRAGHVFWHTACDAHQLWSSAAPSGMASRSHRPDAPGFDRDPGLFSSGPHRNAY
jgi:hypothetical protein